MRNFKIQISQFEEDQNDQRSIEKALSIEYCHSQGGRLVYEENGKPWLLLGKDYYYPLCISHTSGLHLIGQENIGIDVEKKRRSVVLKEGWFPKTALKVSSLEWLMMGEACLKLLSVDLATLVRLPKDLTNAPTVTASIEDKIISKKSYFLVIGTERLKVYFFDYLSFQICILERV